jgi:hypothetical protein
MIGIVLVNQELNRFELGAQPLLGVDPSCRILTEATRDERDQ